MTNSADTSDTDLLRQMRAGTAAAFQALYRRHQGPLFRFALLRCGSRDTAADVVQEVFMALISGQLKFDPLRGQLQHFLFGVARNVLLKHEAPRLRLLGLAPTGEADEDDTGSDGEIASEEAEPLERLLSGEMAEQVRQALARLAPHYRDVLILYEMHELSYLEIAEICQVEIGTVRSRLSRGRAALARRLDPQRDGGAPAAACAGNTKRQTL
ncbi:MAG: RNA polymerase sigma factor [Pseudomonadota bacterium]